MCIGVISGVSACFNFNFNSDSSDSNVVTNQATNQASNNAVLEDLNIEIPEPFLKILNTTICTGNSLDAKSVCTINVETNDTIQDVIVKITYFRDGKILNKTEKVNATIGLDGNIMLESKYAFSKYPDHCLIKIYTPEGKLLDSVNIILKTDDSIQLASGDGNVTAISITKALHSAAQNAKAKAKVNPDEGSFYSAQAGRVIHVGEVQYGADGHRWKHLGYNEWVKID